MLEKYTAHIEVIQDIDSVSRITADKFEYEWPNLHSLPEGERKFAATQVYKEMSKLALSKIREKVESQNFEEYERNMVNNILKIYNYSKTGEGEDLERIGYGEEGVVTRLVDQKRHFCSKNTHGYKEKLDIKNSKKTNVSYKREFKVLRKLANLAQDGKISINYSKPYVLARISVVDDADGAEENDLRCEIIMMEEVRDMRIEEDGSKTELDTSLSAQQFSDTTDIENKEKFGNALEEFGQQVDEMNKNHIYHRDLHKGNVLIQRIYKPGGEIDYKIHIIDFGQASTNSIEPYIDIESNTRYTSDPEQIRALKYHFLKETS